MNAHTTIIRRRRSFSERVRSRAYHTGFVEGFGALSLIDSTNNFNFLKSIDSSFADAWKAVGDSLIAAAKAKEAEFGKAAGEANPSD